MLKVHKIAELYNLKLSGNLKDAEINNVNSLDNQKIDGLSWIKNQKSLNKVKKGFFIVRLGLKIFQGGFLCFNVSFNSRLVYVFYIVNI